LLQAHGLISKIPRTHRWQVTKKDGAFSTALLAARSANTEKLVGLPHENFVAACEQIEHL